MCERLNLLELSGPVMEFQEKTTRCTWSKIATQNRAFFTANK
jgi:hypothetical protein